MISVGIALMTSDTERDKGVTRLLSRYVLPVLVFGDTNASHDKGLRASSATKIEKVNSSLIVLRCKYQD